MCRQRAGCNAGTLRARSLVEAAARDVQPKGRLQPWNSKGWRPKGRLVAAGGSWGLNAPTTERYVQAKGRLQCWNSKADGQRAWWKLPRGNWRVLSVLRVLSVWSLANGRLECLNKRGLCAGKCSKGWRPEGLVEAAARELEGFKRFKGLKPGKRQAWMP